MNRETKTKTAREKTLAIILPPGQPPKTDKELCSPGGTFMERKK